MDSDHVEIAVQYQMKGPATPREKLRRKPPRRRKLDERIQWGPVISSDSRNLLVFFQFHTIPCSSSLWPRPQVLMQSRKKYSFLCQWLTWNQSTLAASHQGRMVCASMTASWMSLALFSQISSALRFQDGFYEKSPTFSKQDLVWHILLCWLKSSQLSAEAFHILLMFILSGYEKATRWTNPSMWHLPPKPQGGAAIFWGVFLDILD